MAADAGTAAAATADVTTGAAQSELNRRLGNVALAGAAVAGALVLALALGGAEVPISDVSGRAPSLIPIDPGSGQGNGENGGGDPGGGGGDGNGGHVDQPDGDQIQGFYPIQPFDAAASPVAFTVPAPDAFLPVESLEAGPGGARAFPHDDGTRGYDKQEEARSRTSALRFTIAGCRSKTQPRHSAVCTFALRVPKTSQPGASTPGTTLPTPWAPPTST